MPYYIHYVVGVSVGVMSQPTAIAVIEQESLQKKSDKSEIQEIRLRHFSDRQPLDEDGPCSGRDRPWRCARRRF